MEAKMGNEIIQRISQAVLLDDTQELYLIFMEFGMQNLSIDFVYEMFNEATGIDYTMFNSLLLSLRGVTYYECVIE